MNAPPPVQRTIAAGTAMRTLLWLALGGMVGAWAFFGLVVAPTAFRILPSTALAGTLVGPVLTALNLYGIGASLLVAALARPLDRGALCRWLPLLMALAILYSQFGVSPEIAEIRDAAFGPEGSELGAARFNHLHRVSMGIYLGVGLAAVWLVGLHSHADEASRGR
jgi:hypothetical protein